MMSSAESDRYTVRMEEAHDVFMTEDLLVAMTDFFSNSNLATAQWSL